MKIKLIIAVGLLLASFVAGIAFSELPDNNWGVPVVEAEVAKIRERTTGSIFGVMFWEKGVPHYGVSFRGSWGSDPNYLGPGGNAATNPYSGGIKNWDWWGNELGTLLTPKRWLCYPLFNCGSERTDPRKYDALVTR